MIFCFTGDQLIKELDKYVEEQSNLFPEQAGRIEQAKNLTVNFLNQSKKLQATPDEMIDKQRAAKHTKKLPD